MKLHPLEKIAKKHFGVTDSLEETGYVLTDGTFLDLSGRHQAGGYVRKGDRFVPQRGQPDYLQGARVIDHRQLPSEIFDAVGTREGSAAMFKFLRETGAIRFMPSTGFLVARMPTIESLSEILREWHHAFGDEPMFVDVITPEGDVRESQELERPNLEEVMEFLESKFGASMDGARDGFHVTGRAAPRSRQRMGGIMNRGEPWPKWAYHVTSLDRVDAIAAEGLKAEPNEKANDEPVIFVEPDLDGVLPYHHQGKTAVLRFRTPGFGELDNGETVLFAQSEYPDGYPDAPLQGPRGGVGKVVPERLQILHKGKWRWLLPDAENG